MNSSTPTLPSRVVPVPLHDVRPARAARPAHGAPRGSGEPPAVHLYTPSADPSGMGVHMRTLAEEYAGQGRRVTLMYWANEKAERLFAPAEALGVRLARMPHPRDATFGSRIVADLRRHPSDVFHVHVGTGRENFDGARAATAAGTPAVVQTLHLPWLIHNRRKREPMHASLEGVDRVITVSQRQRATYAKVGVHPERMTTVPNGVVARSWSPGRAAARRELDLTPQQPVLMTVGRLTVMKGQRHLLDAVPVLLERYPDLVVLLVGDGHLRAALADQADRLGINHAVRFLGHRPDARGLLDAADVFVLPSLQEGMPLAALEAMDAGLPVVGTDVVGTSEVVQDGLTGRLVRPGDPLALARALAHLLGEPSLRRRMGAAGRRRYEDGFTAALMARRTADVYDDVLAAARVSL